MTAVQTQLNPLACTLETGAFEVRTAKIAELNREALISQERTDLRLRSVYRNWAAGRVHELVREERECCPALVSGTPIIPTWGCGRNLGLIKQ